MSHCGFDLHFPDEWCRPSPHVSVGHLCVFGKTSTQVLHPFLKSTCFLMSCMSSLYILDINYLLAISFANTISHSVGCHFVFLIVSFTAQKLFSLWSHLFLLLFPVSEEPDPKNITKTDVSILPLFSKSFMVLGIMFNSLVHFEFIFVYGVKK